MNTAKIKSVIPWSTVAFILIIISVIVRFTLPLRDGDIWWHMLYGKHFLENLTLTIDHSMFSWTPTDDDTIYCAWLPEIILYLLYKIGGLPALFAVRFLSFAIFIAAIWQTARKRNVADNQIIWLVCLLGVHISFAGTFVKAEIFSYIFMILTAWNWWTIKNSSHSSWKQCYLFPLIMLFWVNSHGGFLFGVIFLSLVAFGELINVKAGLSGLTPETRKHLFISLVLTAFTLLLTPYGYHYPLHIFQFILPTAENIQYIHTNQAYMSPYDTQSSGLGNAMLGNISVVLLVFLLIQNIRLKKVDATDLLINLCFIFFFTKYLRTTFFWAPIFAFTSIHLLANISLADWSKAKRTLILQGIAPATFLLVFLAMLYQPLYMPIAYGWLGFGICENTPVEEARFIKKHYAGHNIGNTFAQGSYLLWELFPESQVSLDSRQFPYKSWFSDQQQFVNGKNVEDFLKKYPAKIWCIDLGMYPLLDWFLASDDWHLAFYGISSAVFVKSKDMMPRERYTAGKGLQTLKNPFTALQVLTFSFDLGDLDSAELLVQRIEKIFTKSPRKKFVREARQFYEAILAYNTGNFENAVPLFRESWQRFRDPTMLVNSLLFLADTAGRQENWDTAMQLASEAFTYEQNKYTIYNLGVLSWYFSIKGANLQLVEHDWNWEELLTIFPQNVPRDSETLPHVRNAELILQGNVSKIPPLYLPPLP